MECLWSFLSASLRISRQQTGWGPAGREQEQGPAAPCLLPGSFSWHGGTGCCLLVHLCPADVFLASVIWEYTFFMHCCLQPGALLGCGSSLPAPRMSYGDVVWYSGPAVGAMSHRLPTPWPQQGLCGGAELLSISHGVSSELCVTERMLKNHHWTDQMMPPYFSLFEWEVTVVFQIPHGGSCW